MTSPTRTISPFPGRPRPVSSRYVTIGGGRGPLVAPSGCVLSNGIAMNVLVATSSCRSEFGYPKASHQQVGLAGRLFPTTDEEVGGFDILMDKLVVVRILKSVCGLR